VHRVFLDASVLFSAAYAPKAGLRRLWKLEDVELLTSAYALEEARRNLTRPAQRARLTRLRRQVARQVALVPDVDDEPLPAGIELPAKDRPVLLAAIEHGATHLVTGDHKHFGRYFGSVVQGVLIMTPADYLALHAESKPD
jgi:uncharacterized protein